jgi:hypothetical protein
VLLFYEHTWGSWNSVGEPEADFTRAQWETKKTFADSALERAAALRRVALEGREPLDSASMLENEPRPSIEVLNTGFRERSEVVLIPPSLAAGVSGLSDESGAAVPAQKLSDGSLAFHAEAVPALGARVYGVEAEPIPHPLEPDEDRPAQTALDNGIVRVVLDGGRGTIASLRLRGGPELVPPGEGLNEYLYVPGRDPSGALTGGAASVRITDEGPLVWTALVHREASGTEAGVETVVRLFAGSERVEIANRLDKTLTYEPEAVLFRFPIRLDGARTTVSGPWGAWQAEIDQPPGANRNYATMERWVDMHGRTAGMTLISVDVPGIQIGSLGTDATVVGWRERVDPAPVLFSYVMNNYWETNYRAGQDGRHEFRYVLRPHSGFDEAGTERFAMEWAQPLVVVAAGEDTEPVQTPISIDARATVFTLLRDPGDGEGLVLRLYNPSDASDTVEIRCPGGAPATVRRASLWGEPTPDSTADGMLFLAPRELVTVRVQP